MVNSSKSSGHTGQKIDALDFELPGQSSPGSDSFEFNDASKVVPNRPWWHSQFNLMLAVFGLLLLTAFLFIALSPAPDAKRFNAIVTSDGNQSESQASSVQASETDSETPFDESRNQQARGDSQDVLSDLLRTKGELELQQVTLWAESEFQSAIEAAEAGDQFYSRQDFVAAENSYKRALQTMQALNERVPSVIDGLVSEGQAAITEGKSELATAAFEKALKIDANNISALLGVERAKTLNQVLDLLRAAADDESLFQEEDQFDLLDAADQKYQQALSLDAQTPAATLGLTRVAGLRADKNYRDAMTLGFNNLFSKRYRDAKKHFSAALKIRANDETALAAYRQSLASDSRSSISSLLSNARRFEQQEQWSSALGSYQTVLQRDPNQVSAKVGEVRSKVRLELDQTIKALLQDPLAVAKSSVRKDIESALVDAKALATKGPIIKSQIADLESTLNGADADIKVEFTSDALTDLSLSREGTRKIKLGKFSLRRLSLKPGRYVLSGSRLGYRDVRLSIELRANGQQVQNFHLACTESLANSDSLKHEEFASLKLNKI